MRTVGRIRDWLVLAVFLTVVASFAFLITNSASGWTPWRSFWTIVVLLWFVDVVRRAVRSSPRKKLPASPAGPHQ